VIDDGYQADGYVVGGLVFARIISAQTAADQIDVAVRIAKQQLPGTRGQQGYRGFYVLADRASARLMTISLWDSPEALRAVEAHAARAREEAAESIGTVPPADVYQVEIADRPDP
jgi:heme-degrading monooxygenase HmoA